VGGWDPDPLAGAGAERARLQAFALARTEALAELEPLKVELRERARRIAQREAELEDGRQTDTPEEPLLRRAQELAAAERAALEAVDTRARALDARAKELARLARELEARAAAGVGLKAEHTASDPGFAGFSEGFEAFAESRRQRRAADR
jgi:hypothetical protein